MSVRDSRGMPLSTRSAQSLARYEQALDLIHGYFVEPMAVLDAALAEEPDFVMAHCMRAGYSILFGDKAMQPQLRAAVEAGEALADIANDRERRHLAAARAWLNGEFGLGVRRYGEILEDYPRDSLAIQLAHVGDFFLGQSTLLRDRIAQVLPHWNASVPGYGYLLGMHAFGLEECGDYARAEDSGRRALELNARDPWAVHAVAHVMEMQGRHADGIEWLTSRRQNWVPDNAFAIHNWWHLALYHLDLSNHARVLELYDSQIRAQPSTFALDLVDATALLWRLHLRGVDLGKRFHEVADCWEPTAQDGFYAFNDAHAMMSFVAAGRAAAMQKLLATLEARAQGHGTNGMMTREVGLPLCRALAAFSEERYTQALDLLTDIRSSAQRFGGSNAQRDLIHLTMLEAAHRAGRHRLAFALAAERTRVKPTSPYNWILAARSAGSIGDRETGTAIRDYAIQQAREKSDAVPNPFRSAVA
jgi:tetratricopeptide (TPR) repeat protein